MSEKKEEEERKDHQVHTKELNTNKFLAKIKTWLTARIAENKTKK